METRHQEQLRLQREQGEGDSEGENSEGSDHEGTSEGEGSTEAEDVDNDEGSESEGSKRGDGKGSSGDHETMASLFRMFSKPEAKIRKECHKSLLLLRDQLLRSSIIMNGKNKEVPVLGNDSSDEEEEYRDFQSNVAKHNLTICPCRNRKCPCKPRSYVIGNLMGDGNGGFLKNGAHCLDLIDHDITQIRLGRIRRATNRKYYPIWEYHCGGCACAAEYGWFSMSGCDGYSIKTAEDEFFSQELWFALYDKKLSLKPSDDSQTTVWAKALLSPLKTSIRVAVGARKKTAEAVKEPKKRKAEMQGGNSKKLLTLQRDCLPAALNALGFNTVKRGGSIKDIPNMVGPCFVVKLNKLPAWAFDKTTQKLHARFLPLLIANAVPGQAWVLQVYLGESNTSLHCIAVKGRTVCDPNLRGKGSGWLPLSENSFRTLNVVRVVSAAFNGAYKM